MIYGISYNQNPLVRYDSVFVCSSIFFVVALAFSYLSGPLMATGVRNTKFGQLCALGVMCIVIGFTIYGFTVTTRRAEYEKLSKTTGDEDNKNHAIISLTARKFERLLARYDCAFSNSAVSCTGREGVAYINELLIPKPPEAFMTCCKRGIPESKMDQETFNKVFCPVAYGIMERAESHKKSVENLLLLNMLFLILQMSLFITYHKMIEKGFVTPPEAGQVAVLFPSFGIKTKPSSQA